ALEDTFQDRRSPELIGVSLVVGRRCNVQRDRVADLCFVVVGIALGQPFHGLEMGLNEPAMGNLVVIGIEGQQSIDIVALAPGLGADRSGFLQGGEPKSKILLGWGNMWVLHKGERNSPIGDGAFGIGLERLLKNFLGWAVPERMLIPH